MIVAGGTDDITVYDADTLEILFQELNAHSGRVNDVAFFSAPDGLKIASGGNDGALKLWQVPGCSVPADCDDSNECTIDGCAGGVCQHTPVSDETPCDAESGICCDGSCDTDACWINSDCDDRDFCSQTDTCINSGTCTAACVISFPACNFSQDDECCGPACDHSNDLDCPTPTCVPTHNKEKGPRCSDGIDNDCDGDIDGADPDC
jgi:WD40 repeat protein